MVCFLKQGDSEFQEKTPKFTWCETGSQWGTVGPCWYLALGSGLQGSPGWASSESCHTMPSKYWRKKCHLNQIDNICRGTRSQMVPQLLLRLELRVSVAFTHVKWVWHWKHWFIRKYFNVIFFPFYIWCYKSLYLYRTCISLRKVTFHLRWKLTITIYLSILLFSLNFFLYFSSP